ncbi:MAG: sel1 repeat family protein [Ectothiorhodospiraceae bacterium]|nr:sel1 repeat family protein [Chromatiales bacterium]MCP5154435.1 sel1 repeat family protein [Ectothiorhodospiraceae bacterium]
MHVKHLLVTAVLTLSAPFAGAQTYDEALAVFDEARQSGEQTHPGYAKALAAFQPLADGGDARAQYHVGVMHLYGLGGAEFDQWIGMQWIKRAAEGGYHTAQSFMGLMVEKGDGTMTLLGDDHALEWYRKGAEGGHCVAVRRLVRAYEQGELGLAKDPAQADTWRTRLESCSSR